MRKITTWIKDHGDAFFALFGLCFIGMMLRLVVVALEGRGPEEDFWANALLVLATGSILVYVAGFLLDGVIQLWNRYWGDVMFLPALEKHHIGTSPDVNPNPDEE